MTKDIILLRYINAVENGDLDTLSEIWDIAQNDAALTRELLDISAEIGGVPMFHNGLVRVAAPPQRNVSTRTIYRRVALFLIAIAGLLAMLALFSQYDSPIVTAPIGGSTPTMVPPDALAPISLDNVGRLAQVAQYGEGSVGGVKWTPDGEHIIAYGAPGYWLYDADNLDAEPQFIDMGLLMRDVAFTEDGDTIFFASESTIYMADLMSGEITYTLETSLEPSITLMTGNGLLVYHDWAFQRFYAWDIEKQRERFVFGTGIRGAVVTMAFDEETNVIGILFSTLNETGLTLTLIDAETGEDFARDTRLPSGYPPRTQLVLEKDRVIVTSDAEWFKWDADLANRRLDVNSKQPLDYDGTLLGILGVAPLHDDAGLLLSRDVTATPLYIYRDERLIPLDYELDEFWFLGYGLNLHPQRNEVLFLKRLGVEIVDALTGDVVDTVPIQNWQSTLNHVAYDQGRLITHDLHKAIVRQDGTVYTTPDEITVIRNVLPGNDVVYINGSVEQYTSGIIVWDYRNGTYEELFRVRSGVTDWVITHDRHDIYYSAVSSFLHRYDLVETRNTTLAKPPEVGPNDYPSNFVISPDDQYIALNYEKTVYVYDLEIGKFLDPLTGHSNDVIDLLFSPDGSKLYSLNSSGNWIIWETGDWSEFIYREATPTIGNIVMSPDGSIIAGSSQDEIVILDASTFEEISHFKAHLGYIYSVNFSDDGKRIVTGGSDGMVRVWGISEVNTAIPASTPTPVPDVSLASISVDNVTDLTQVEQHGEGVVRGVKWTPDGEHIIAYGSPGYWIYDADDLNAEPQLVDLNLVLFDVAFTEDGDTIIFGAESDTSASKSAIYMADLETGEITYTLETGLEPYLHLTTGNGLLIYQDWSSGRLYGWDIELRRERFVYTPEALGNIIAIDFEEETGVVGLLSTITYDDGFTLALVDTNTGEELSSRNLEITQNLQLAGMGPPHASLLVEKDRVIVASDAEWFEWNANLETGRLSPSGRHPLGNDSPAVAVFDLVSLHGDNGVLVQRTSGYTPLYLYRDEHLVLVDYRIPETAYFSGMSLHPARNEVLYLNRESVEIVDAISGDVIDTVPVKYWNATVSDVTYDQGRLIAHDDHNITVWQGDTAYTTPDDIKTIIGMLPGNDVIYINGAVNLNTWGIIAWDYEHGSYEELFRFSNTWVTDWTISHDRHNIYYAPTSDFVHRFNVVEGKDTVLAQPPGTRASDAVANFTVSPDDRYLAMSYDRRIFVYDVVNETFSDPLTGHSTDISDLFFKADGSQMYSLDESGNWIVWDTSTWTEFDYHESVPIGFRTALSPDGTLLGGAITDEVVFYDAATFEEVYRFSPHVGSVSKIAFSDDGRHFITCGGDGTIRVWGVRQN